MDPYDPTRLSRREGQIMESLFRRRRASARDVQADLPEAPGYSAVRKMLEILEEKGYVDHVREGRHYVYFPAVSREAAGRSAIRRALGTFFDGSFEAALTALLRDEDLELTEAELERIARMAKEAREEGG